MTSPLVTNDYAIVLSTANTTIANSETVGPGGLYANYTGAVFGPRGTAWRLVNDGAILGYDADFGVYLRSGGSVTNSTTSYIEQSDIGVAINGGTGTVANYGVINGDAGVLIGAGGNVINGRSGLIEGGRYGVAVGGFSVPFLPADTAPTNAPGTVTNFGSITGLKAGVLGGYSGGGITVVNGGLIQETGTYSSKYPTAGILLFAGGQVTNLSDGTISGTKYGIEGTRGGRYPEIDGTVTVVNAGSIVGRTSVGVVLSGGSVTNQSGGLITGDGGIYNNYFFNTMIVLNAGSIVGGAGTGVIGAGSVINQSGGLISGYSGIVSNYGSMTVVNAGTIIGIRDAVMFTPGDNLLTVDPGAVFIGTVVNNVANYTVGTLDLASGEFAGTLSGIGTQFVGFDQITVDLGASWTLIGGNSFAANTTMTNAGTLTVLDTQLSDAGLVVNDGTVLIDPSSVTLADLSGTGVVTIDGGSTLDVLGAVTNGETVVFGSGSNLLDIDPVNFSGQINGFDGGDTIELAGVADATSAGIINHNTLEIQRGAHPAVDLILDPSTNYTGSVPTVGPDGAVTTEAPCFLRGTLIRTETGEKPVQDLKAGDHVMTLSGAIKPIVWIGVGRVLVSPRKRSAATPVIIRKGAISDNVPYQDLHVTKGHAVYVGGVLIPAEFLINHRSVLWDDHQQTVAFYHIELATHDVLVANGAACESYRDDANRWMFENANSGWEQPPQQPCAPVLTGGPVVDEIWRRLLDRAGPRPNLTLTDEPDLYLLVDGVRLDAAPTGEGVYVFNLPGTKAAVRLVSRAAAPQELGLARDPRSLGVAVRRIIVRRMTQFRVIEAYDQRLRIGFHEFERDDGLRWTDGDATLPASLFYGIDGAIELVLHLGGSTKYPTFSRAMIRAAA